MPELPSGTVTFLFTDIERSTESAAALGDERWAEALQIHRDLLRPAFVNHGGVGFGTEGDSFFVAFARAGDAVAAAREGQIALEAHAWPGEARLRVRMGLHTGEALVRGGGYVGHEIHRAKRISDAAHGGQILLSETTADLIGKTSLTDLGSHRLKDLGEPQHIYQLTDDALQRDFPPLRSLDAFTHSLPLQRSAFIGREKEIADVRELLETNRIVTLTGVGGCGKTRIALQVGAEELDHFPGGVFFVNLAPISDPDLVVGEVATSVGTPMGGGIAGVAPAGPPHELLMAHLRGRKSLIVIDNCEHLVDVCAETADQILASCPDVTILATSREALRVEGEQAWSVPSLSLPPEDGDAQASESVSLFKARAKAVRKGFELTPDNLRAVVEICRRLDGIPLALEFAAARVSHLSPRQIADRLDDRFRLLTGGQRRVQRQHTLQAALDWSFELLDSDERVLLRRLSVFAGDFPIEAAEGVCTDDELGRESITDLLGSLVSKSLVDADVFDNEIRYKLLETVRAYAAQRLAQADEAERFRSRHRDWYVEWLDSIPLDDATFSLAAAMRLNLEGPNLNAAAEWSAAENRLDLVARIVARSGNVFRQNILATRWARVVLESDAQLDPDDHLRLLVASNAEAVWEGAGVGVAGLSDKALEGASSSAMVYALTMRGIGRAYLAAFTRDNALKDKSDADFELAEQHSRDQRGEYAGMVVWSRAHSEMIFGKAPKALPFLERSIASFNAAGNDPMAKIITFYLALVAHVLDKHEQARHAWNDYASAMTQYEARFNVRQIDPDALVTGINAIFATLVAIHEGLDDAWTFLVAQRPLVIRRGVRRDLEDLVLGCAVVRAIHGEHECAAELLSWVRANTLAAGRPLATGAHYLLYLHYRDIIRRALGAEEAQGARERGERMSLDDAVELAFANKVPA